MRQRAVGIVIENNRLLVIHRQKPGQDYYVLPGGGMEPGETADEACRREIMEETGLRALAIEPVCSLENHGNQKHYFRVVIEDRSPVLGGPEASRNSERNRYFFEWVSAAQLNGLHLLPKATLKICVGQLQSEPTKGPYE